MNEKNPAAFYTAQIQLLETQRGELRKKGNVLAIMRGFSFLGAFALGWLLWPQGWPFAFAVTFAGLMTFGYFVSLDLANKKALENTTLLLQINQEELKHLSLQYVLPGDGKEWEMPDHPYAADLDIFGKSSLFRYINRCNAGSANRLLASWLQAPAEPAVALARQAANRELAASPAWCQQLQAHGRTHQITIATETNITAWLRLPAGPIQQSHWKFIRFLFPALSFTCLGLYLFDVIPWSLFTSIMLVFLGVSFQITKTLMPAWKQLGRITAELESFSDTLQHIEDSNFSSPLLKELRNDIAVSNGMKASASVRQLRGIMDRLDYKLNPVVYIPLSAFLCWDLHQALALDKWKRENKHSPDQWFGGLARMEAMASTGILTFNHPEWHFPEFSTEAALLRTKNMGHPLIPAAKRVCSDFNTSGNGTINLITGSNMAGKSTFLRSTGINIVLSMMGAPVCADSMTLSPFRVMSSMRISDNLEESTSTFYAELKKLKTIIEAVEHHEPVFLLLDEILRGTNSADRHAGSGALIRQLILQRSAGMVATHDLELAKLANEFPDGIRNYHFDVQIDGEELYFDYKLKDGVCKSMNASLLMKKIGIRM